VIGKNLVAVPTHFFKIAAYYKNGCLTVESYKMPNRPITEEQPLHMFHCNVAEIEKYSGLQFFGNLNKSMIIKADIETLYTTAKL
jgi:DNA/RNA endonuclease G (NUC1)